MIRETDEFAVSSVLMVDNVEFARLARTGEKGGQVVPGRHDRETDEFAVSGVLDGVCRFWRDGKRRALFDLLPRPGADPRLALAGEHNEYLGGLVLMRRNRFAALRKHFEASHDPCVSDG